MDRVRTIKIAVASGAVFALCAGAITWQLLAFPANQTGAGSGESPVSIAVCAATIKTGERITDLNVKAVNVPRSLVPDGAITAAQLPDVQGERVSSSLGKGEIITQRRIDGATSPLDGVRSGFTAVTVAADPVRALGGQIAAGMQVQLMAEEVLGSAVTIAQEVRVISTSVVAPSPDDSPLISGAATSVPDITWVTVEVPDELVESVVQASSANSIYLVLPGITQDADRG